MPARTLCSVAGPERAIMTTRDGVSLVADIYRPQIPGKHPVLLMRQPYGRRIASTVVFAHPAWYAAHGYIVIIQDVRGRGESGGTFRLFADDIDDGADTLAWAADLPGANGRVGMYGFSYQGTNQLLAMAGARRAGSKRPDALAVTMAGWTIRDDWAYEGNAFRLAGNIGWACQMGAEAARLAGDEEAFTALATAGRAGPQWRGAPALPDALVRHAHYTHHADWLRDDPAYWSSIAPASALADDPLDVPVLHVGGWQDTMLAGTLACHATFDKAGLAPQRLVIGPWTHMPWGRNVGALDLGANAVSPIEAEQLAFFDAHLRNDGTAPRGIRLFDVGAKTWRDFSHWPETRELSLYLGSNGLAAATPDRGELSDEPGADGGDILVHDPWRPAPALGGATGQPGGFQNRAAIDDRADVAVYTSAPLNAPLFLAGEIGAELAVACDQPSHDLSCHMSIVSPDGRAMSLAIGFLRVADAGAPGLRRVHLGSVCCTIPAGHAIRLSVQAAAWPAFMVNPGPHPPAPESRIMDCRITTLHIKHGRAVQSRLILPCA
ncbi:MAG: CocE/NonD family hydrolase [Pseudorhodoplanes sp.]|nr:CocE/NonD family hydrolase [Pseudorhodoplanes sp.]